jgi:hypothetical protein
MGARFYDPSLNRWISADTLVPDPNDPQSLNRYSWVGNNPLGYIDPSGHYRRAPMIDGYGPGYQGDLPINPRGCGAPIVLPMGSSQDVILMPPGSRTTVRRSPFSKRLGTSMGIAGLVYDIVEAAGLIFTPLATADEDVGAFFDFGVTLLSGAFSGQNYILESPHPDLPRMVAIDQDAIVTGGDMLIGGSAKSIGAIAGAAVGGHLVLLLVIYLDMGLILSPLVIA